MMTLSALAGLALPAALLLRSLDRALARAVHRGLTVEVDDVP